MSLMERRKRRSKAWMMVLEVVCYIPSVCAADAMKLDADRREGHGTCS